MGAMAACPWHTQARVQCKVALSRFFAPAPKPRILAAGGADRHFMGARGLHGPWCMEATRSMPHAERILQGMPPWLIREALEGGVQYALKEGVGAKRL